MKVRHGFVSNSSSSSFVIASKDGSEITEEKILRCFKIQEDSIFYQVAKAIAKILINSDTETKETIFSDWGIDSIDDLPKEYKKALQLGDGTFLRGSACSDSGDAVEYLLCDMDLDYEDDEIFIYKEWGY